MPRSARRGTLTAVSASIPTTHIAGDTFAATLDGSTYAATAGWSAALILIGPARQTINATASGDDHLASAAGSTTASWAAGSYAMRAVYTKAADRYSVELGTLAVAPDPAAVGTDARALLSTAAQALQDLEAAYRAHLASGNVHVSEYEIAGRRMKYRSVAELLKALGAARREVAAERAAKRISAGLSPRAQFVTRM